MFDLWLAIVYVVCWWTQYVFVFLLILILESIRLEKLAS